MLQGQLMFTEDRQLLLIVLVGSLPVKRVIIKPESALELHLGNVWIQGQYGPYYDEKGEVEIPLFVCENHTFCRLHDGMGARLPNMTYFKEELGK